jgi:hypothetical protein
MTHGCSMAIVNRLFVHLIDGRPRAAIWRTMLQAAF